MGKYLKNNLGQIEEANPATAGGVPNANQIPQLDAAGLIPLSMLPPTVTDEVILIVENGVTTAPGDFVNISPTGEVRLAIAYATGQTADGFVLDAVIGDGILTITVYFEGRNTAISGATPGTKYFLSSTLAGKITATAPSTAGEYVQLIGKAYLATAMTTENLSGYTILLA